MTARLTGEPWPSCYGCQGTGFLRGFGSRPGTACSCVTHSVDCEPEGCASDCPEKRVFIEGLTDGFMRCPGWLCHRIVDYSSTEDPTMRRLYPHPPCDVGMVVKDTKTGNWVRPRSLV